MKLQFLYCYNPNQADQGAYIEHHGEPRFTAKVGPGGRLELYRKLDGENVDYAPKLARAQRWYYSIIKMVER